MAAEPVQLPTSGSLAGILDVLETDEDFRALISDEIEVPESDIDPSITVGVPEGLRPALAAGAAGTRPVVLSGGFRARGRGKWLRRFVRGIPAIQTMWHSLKRGKPCRTNVFRLAPIPWRAVWRCSAD